jgi:hypothetical protein
MVFCTQHGTINITSMHHQYAIKISLEQIKMGYLNELKY